MATRYATGDSVPQDYSLALRWYLKAAEQGHVGAQDTLGAYYWLGHGAPKDVSRAYFWSVLARAEGKEASKVRVAFMTSQLTRAQAEAIQREAEKFLKQHPPLMNSENPVKSKLSYPGAPPGTGLFYASPFLTGLKSI